MFGAGNTTTSGLFAQQQQTTGGLFAQQKTGGLFGAQTSSAGAPAFATSFGTGVFGQTSSGQTVRLLCFLFLPQEATANKFFSPLQVVTSKTYCLCYFLFLS